MAGTRRSARLRKRPPVYYAPPENSDLDDDMCPDKITETDGAHVASGASVDSDSDDHSDDHSDSDSDLDQEAHSSGRKKKRARRSRSKDINKRKTLQWADMPGEIRNMVYSYCLEPEVPMQLNCSKKKGRNIVYPTVQRGLNPNLLLVNKATYIEGGPLLYSRNFVFGRCPAMYVFLAGLSATPKSWIRIMTLKTWENQPRNKSSAFLLPAFTSLIGTTNLERLQLDFMIQDQPVSHMEFARQLFGSAHFWFEAVAREKRSKQKAVELIRVQEPPNPDPVDGLFGNADFGGIVLNAEATYYYSSTTYLHMLLLVHYLE